MEVEDLEGWKCIGEVVHFFEHPSAGIIKLIEDGLKIGDVIKIKGCTTDLEQEVSSMQIEHDEIEEAKKGDEVGIKVRDRVRKHDVVYKTI